MFQCSSDFGGIPSFLSVFLVLVCTCCAHLLQRIFSYFGSIPPKKSRTLEQKLKKPYKSIAYERFFVLTIHIKVEHVLFFPEQNS